MPPSPPQPPTSSRPEKAPSVRCAPHHLPSDQSPIRLAVFGESNYGSVKWESGVSRLRHGRARLRARAPRPGRPPVRGGACPPRVSTSVHVVERHCTRNECTACCCAPIGARPADRCAARARGMPPRSHVRSAIRRARERLLARVMVPITIRYAARTLVLRVVGSAVRAWCWRGSEPGTRRGRRSTCKDSSRECVQVSMCCCTL